MFPAKLINQANPLLLSKAGIHSSTHLYRARVPNVYKDVYDSIPEKPKRPMNAYLMYLQERKNIVKADSWTEMVAQIGQEWRNLSDKSKYEQMCYDNKYKFKQDIDKFRESLTPEQSDLLSDLQSSKKQFRAEIRLARTNIPKLPRNLWNFYVMDHVKFNPGTSFRLKDLAQQMKEKSEDFKKLSSDEKEVYNEMAKKDKERFKKEFSEWYENITKDPAVRKSVRILAEKVKKRYTSIGHLD